MSLKHYFQEELTHLRDLGTEFSRLHPALAPMLSGPSRDPDVERLLEGVAYLAATLRHRMNDEFPEFISALMFLSVPHLLQPSPSTTLMEFRPEEHLSASREVPAGTPVNSIAVDGTVCCFETSQPMTMLPLKTGELKWEELDSEITRLTLPFKVLEGAAGRWKPDSIRLHCAGETGPAGDLYTVLTSSLHSLTLRDNEGRVFHLPPGSVVPAGLGEHDGLLPYPMHIFPGFRILLEYFILPEKFLTVSVQGLGRRLTAESARSFELIFECKKPPAGLKPGSDSLLLNIVPACNSFERDSQPIPLSHQVTEYAIRPERDEGLCQVIGVNHLEGIARKTGTRRTFLPFRDFEGSHESPLYVLRWHDDAHTEEVRTYLELVYPRQSAFINEEILIGKLQCCNGHLPERLRLGDIHVATPTSPVHCSFRNIVTPTGMVSPHLDKGSAWRLMAHLRLNLLHLKTDEDLRTILMLYADRRTRDRARLEAGVHRINGIRSFSTRALDRLYRGQLIRGTGASLSLDPRHFAGKGDMHLFGEILQQFFSSQSPINSFVQLTMTDDSTGMQTVWKPKAGDQPLF